MTPRMRRAVAVIIGLVLVAASQRAVGDPTSQPSSTAPATPPGCNGDIGPSTGPGSFGVGGTQICNTRKTGLGNGSQSGTRVLDCGPPRVSARNSAKLVDTCGSVHWACDVYSASVLPTDPRITTEATQQRQADGTWMTVGFNCVAMAAAPQVAPLLVQAEVRKLVPHPRIGVAPPGGTTLVNIQTLLWLDTPANQSLGTVALLGHRVALRIHVQRVDWDFGDETSDSTDDPGRRYDPADGCRTVTCPGYWGHVYDTTGRMTIAATVTWSGQYRVDGGAWLDIPETVTGPATGTTITVRQARGVLVPNPGRH